MLSSFVEFDYEMEQVCVCVTETPGLFSTLIWKPVVHDTVSNSAKIVPCLSKRLAPEAVVGTMCLYRGAELMSW